MRDGVEYAQADQVASIRLTEVRVSYTPDVNIWWGDGERAFATSKGIPLLEAEAAAKTEEGKAYLHGIVTSKVKGAMERELAGKLTGSRPVRVDVVVRDVTITSPLHRIVIGGGHSMKADINVVDATNGAILLTYPAQTATSLAGNGIGGTLVDGMFGNDPIDRVTNDYAMQFRYWLVRA